MPTVFTEQGVAMVATVLHSPHAAKVSVALIRAFVQLRELLSTRRQQLMSDVQREVLEVVKGTKPWGIDIVDVRITRADYVEAITESVYRRMEAERKRVANELRSTGGAEGEKIRADADRQREVTIANRSEEHTSELQSH